MVSRVHIVVAESSVIIRRGVVSVLSKMPELNIDIAEISDMSVLSGDLYRYNAEVLIVDPANVGCLFLDQMRGNASLEGLKIVALQTGMVNSLMLKGYDEVIMINDSLNTIRSKFVKLIERRVETNSKQGLTTREKEVVVCIVRGMSNKQIAEALIVSTHTIMTHRRNIMGKLQIHSPSGLTIYAIVKKLVEIDDIKDTSFSEE